MAENAISGSRLNKVVGMENKVVGMTKKHYNYNYCQKQYKRRNHLLLLCTARTVWSDPVIRPVSVRSGKFIIRMVTNEKREKR